MLLPPCAGDSSIPTHPLLSGPYVRRQNHDKTHRSPRQARSRIARPPRLLGRIGARHPLGRSSDSAHRVRRFQRQRGEGLVAFGANHGNEYEGPMALKRLMNEIRVEDVTRANYSNSRVEPRRVWRGYARQHARRRRKSQSRICRRSGHHPALAGITHRIASLRAQVIWPHVHVVLDLHSGGLVASFGLCASFHPLDDPEQAKASRKRPVGSARRF